MSYAVRQGDKVVCVGDSFNVGGVAGNGVDLGVPSSPISLNLTFGLNTVLQAKGNAGIASLTRSGLIGAVMADILTNVNAWIIALAPDLVFLLNTVNDADGGTLPAAVVATLTTICNTVWAALPATRFVIISIVNVGVKWPDGANVNDGVADAQNAAVLAAIPTIGAGGTIAYCDVRNSYWFPAITAANPGNVTPNYALTVDGIFHPNATNANGISAEIASQATAVAGTGLASIPPISGNGTLANPFSAIPATTSAAGTESAANFTKLAGIYRPTEGAALADADATIQPFSDKASEYTQTVNLTADRSITLGVTGAFFGLSVRIVREGAGAHTLAIINGGTDGGTVYTFGASPTVASSQTFQYDGVNWVWTGVEYQTAS